MSTRPNFVLASASPARRNLLAAAGIDVEIIVSGVDEEAVEATTAEALSGVLARMKAHAVAERLRHNAHPHPHAVVLGCDSVLAFDGQILGKPDGPEEAAERWQAMRGRSGVLHTGHCLIDLADGRAVQGDAATVVHFADISDAEIEAYVASGEPLWVAGSFTIDGLGSAFVERLEGDHTNVIGLSLPLLRRMLAELGYEITQFWRGR
ncbi:Maf-like protein [Catellatospora sp. TT07R-123]|uniref:Maf family protein n=1 Tax=Catellatospora sp. TT07R-123 TaxID=2733863 RepID=UPI001B0460BE|nr:nucleoside triphosphate pyrophosphatase [Catellatospora sp. TT07R-123]GHJ50290.1 Maf-like protein [Catellatospora sp. TT07R-123]